MNRKLEDLIARQAFGDLSQAEEEMLNAQLDLNPELQRLAQSYQHLRMDLSSLKHVPDHQLSNERLRTAILERGLDRPKPVNRWAWLWMPAAAASVAFGLAYARTLLPSAVENPSVVAMKMSPMPIEPLAVPSPSIVRKTGSQKGENSRGTVVAMNPVTTRRRTQHSSHRVDQATEEQAGPGLILAMDSIVRDANIKVEQPTASETPASMAPETSYVVIETERDTSTGAQAATEGATFGHIVVGG
jgi:hypothetical protein